MCPPLLTLFVLGFLLLIIPLSFSCLYADYGPSLWSLYLGSIHPGLLYAFILQEALAFCLILELTHKRYPDIMTIELFLREAVRHGQQMPALSSYSSGPSPCLYTYVMSIWVIPRAGKLSQIWRNFLRGWLLSISLIKEVISITHALRVDRTIFILSFS